MLSAPIHRTLSDYDEVLRNLSQQTSSYSHHQLANLSRASTSIPACLIKLALSHGVYSIGAVARMLEIPAATIRNWEERYADDRPGAERGGTPAVLARPGGAAPLHRGGGLARALGGRRAPAARRTQRRAASPWSSDGPSAGTRLLVLLAERDPVAAELAQFFLRTEGYEVNVGVRSRRSRGAVAREPARSSRSWS